MAVLRGYGLFSWRNWASQQPLVVAQWQRICFLLQETSLQSPGQEDPLEKEMAAHFSILAWEIPWTEEPGQATDHGVSRVGCDLVIKQQ